MHKIAVRLFFVLCCALYQIPSLNENNSIYCRRWYNLCVSEMICKSFVAGWGNLINKNCLSTVGRCIAELYLIFSHFKQVFSLGPRLDHCTFFRACLLHVKKTNTDTRLSYIFNILFSYNQVVNVRIINLKYPF